MQYNRGPHFAKDGDFASVGSARISYVEKLPATVASQTGGQNGYKRALLAGSPEVGAGRVVYGLEYAYTNGPWAQTENFLNRGRGFHSNDARGATQTTDPRTGNAAAPVSALARTTGYEFGLRTQRVPGMTGGKT